MELSQKIDTARNSGFSDDDIAKHMAQTDPSFGDKYSTAVEKGISSREVLDFIKKKEVEEFRKLPYELQAAKIQEASAGAGAEMARSYIEGTIPGSNRLFKTLEEKGYIPEQEQSPEAEMVRDVSKFAGALNPLKLLHKGVTKAASYAPDAVKAIAKYGGAGALTGASYVTGKELAEKGELPPIEDVLTEAAAFGLLEGGVAGAIKAAPPLAKAGRFVKSKWNNFWNAPATEEVLEPFIQGASRSEHEVAQQAAKHFVPQPPPGGPPPPPGAPPGGPAPPGGSPPTTPPAGGQPPIPPPFAEIHVTHPGRNQSLRGRVTQQQSRELGLTRPVTPRNPNAEQAIRGIFPERIVNSTTAGDATAHNIRAQREGAWRAVGDLYTASRASLEGASGEVPELVAQLQERIAQIDAIPHPDAHSAGVRDTAQRLLNRLVRTVETEEGAVTELLPIDAQTLIDQIQATRRQMKFPFMSGEASNVYSPLITDMENAITSIADTEPWRIARQARRNFGELYDNKYISKFSKTDNYDIAKNFKSLEDKDTFNVVRRVLDQTPQGRAIREGVQARITENHLKDFWNNPRDADPIKFREAVEELRAVLEPEQMQRLEHIVEQETRPFNRRARPEETRPAIERRQAEQRATQEAERVRQERATRQAEAAQRRVVKEQERQAKLLAQAAKNMNVKAEDVRRKFNSVSGIREARTKMVSEPNVFDELRKIKNRDIAFKGQIEAKPTGNQLAERFLNAKNYDISVELNGQEATDAAIEAFKLIGDKELTQAVIMKIGKKAAIMKTIGTLGLILL